MKEPLLIEIYIIENEIEIEIVINYYYNKKKTEKFNFKIITSAIKILLKAFAIAASIPIKSNSMLSLVNSEITTLKVFFLI